MYNIFSSKGPDLYGTEPWTFYLLNGALNFNLAFFAALLCPVTVLVSRKLSYKVWERLVISLTVILWIMVFIVQPHKVGSQLTNAKNISTERTS